MLSEVATPDECPEFISVGSMLKAMPRVDGGKRYLYVEASNEDVDQQGEIVLAKALADSADHYLKFGNVDLEHYTITGARQGIPDYPLYEIGQPREVGQQGGSTFVKAEIYQGEGPAAKRANVFWQSMTELKPGQRWYPSVGGAITKRSVEIDPKTQMRKSIVAQVRWVNIGMSKTPVNQHIPAGAVVPVGIFAKCMRADGLDMTAMGEMLKTLTSGYGTDSATLEGGAALREQSLDRKIKSYFDFREMLSGQILDDDAADASPQGMVAWSVAHLGLPQGEATEYVERFRRDVSSNLKKRELQ